MKAARHRRWLWAALAVGGVLLAPAGAAEARLGDAYAKFTRSRLLQGDRLFRFEGRLGARFRFGPARANTLGNPLLLIDVQDGIIVQEILILPLARRERDVPRLGRLVLLLAEDAGLDAGEADATVRAFAETCRTAKPLRKPVGPMFGWMLDILASPELGQCVVALGYRPTALTPGAVEAAP